MTTTSSSVYDLLFKALKGMEAVSGNHSFTAARNKNDAKFKLQLRGSYGNFYDIGEIRYVEMPGKPFAGELLDLQYVELLSRDLAKHSQNVSRESQLAFGATVGALVDNLIVTETNIGDVHSGRMPKRMYLDLKGHARNAEGVETGLLTLKFIFQPAPGYQL